MPSARHPYPSSCAAHPRAATVLHDFSNAARGPAASRRDDVERLASDGLALWLMLRSAQLEHSRQRIEHHLAGLRLGSALTEHAKNLRDRNDDPVVVSLLVEDRQVERVAHKSSVVAGIEAISGQVQKRLIAREIS